MLAKVIVLNATYGKWTTVEGPHKGNVWVCRCVCGTEQRVLGRFLASGRSHRCRFCQTKEPRSDAGREFSNVPKAVLKKLRHAAEHAIDRCTKQSNPRFADWGGRGIQVKFYDWVSFVRYLLTLPGHDNPDLVIDRDDNEGHYEEGNIRFVTTHESSRNKRTRRKGYKQPLRSLKYAQGLIQKGVVN